VQPSVRYDAANRYNGLGAEATPSATSMLVFIEIQGPTAA
jgi:hypothetical protein